MEPVDSSCGIALLEAGKFREAAARFEQDLHAEPSSYSAWYNMGLALYKASELERAREALEEARRLRPDKAEATLNLARVEIDAGDLERARALAESFPDHAQALVLLGHLEEMCGDGERATACFERAIQRDPTIAGAWCGLVRMRVPFDVERLEAIVESGQFRRYDEAALRYALAQVHDREGDAFRAFGHAARAGGLRRSNFDPERYRSLVDELIAARIPAVSQSELAPIFLVGPPRTGSSLLERILEGHPDTRAYGERPDVLLIAQSIAFPRGADQLTTRALDGFAQRYEDGLGDLPPGIRPIEKTPSNVMTIGLLGAMFPRASFVTLGRDPRDVGLSNFLLDFGDHRIAFSTSIEHTHAYLTETDRILRHWESRPDLNVRRQEYEALIDDPEGQLRELLAFLELPWHPDCLGFADRDAPCRTASSQQVRQPLNRRGIGRWEPYAAFLGELAQGIG